MTKIGRWHNRKYYKLLFSIIVVLLASIVALTSISTFVSARGLLIDRQESSERIIMDQLGYNLKQMHELFSAAVSAVYMDANTSMLMYMRSLNMENVSLAYIRLRQTHYLPNSAYLHSIVVYNAMIDEFFNISDQRTRLFSRDEMLESIVNSNGVGIPVQPFFHRTEIRGEAETVVTYAILDRSAYRQAPGSALFVSFYAKYLIDSVDSLNISDSRNDARVFLYTACGDQINTTGEQDAFADWTYQVAMAGDERIANAEYESASYSLQRRTMHDSGIHIVRVRSLASLNAMVDQLVFTQIVNGVVAIALSFLLTWIASVLLYRPVDRTITNLAHFGDDFTGFISDEFGTLSYAYESARTQLLDLKVTEKSARRMRKARRLTRMLTEPLRETEQDIRELNDLFGIELDPDKPVFVIVVCLRGYGQDAPDHMISVTLLNFLSESLSKQFFHEWVELDTHTAAFVLAAEKDWDACQLDVCAIIAMTNTYLRESGLPRFHCAISDERVPLSRLHEAHSSALANLDYSFLYPDYDVLTRNDLIRNVESTATGYSQELTKSLENAIQNADRMSAEQAIEFIFNQILRMDYEHALLCTLHLVREISLMLGSGEAEIDLTYSEIVTSDVNQLRARLKEHVARGLSGRTPESIKSDKLQQALIEAVKRHIDDSFTDPGLCLSSIAEALSRPPRAISKIFRQYTGMAVNDYINNRRLTAVAESLARDSRPVGEILRDAGVENATYFYMLFKKKYGLTPKEYGQKSRYQEYIDKEKKS